MVAERLLAEDARAKELRRKVRKDWRLGLVSLFFGVASIGFGFTQLGIVIRSWSHPESAPFPLTGQFFAQGYHAVQGRLSPETGLTLVLAAVGVCATINVALFVEGLVTSRRAQVELSEGRRILEVAAMLMAVGALAAGVVVWANVNSPSAIGTAIGTSLFAIVTALLSTSARRQVQSADRAHGYTLAVTNLAKLNGWKRELAARGVPRPLGGIPTVVPSKTLWAKYVRGALLRLAVLAGFMVLVLGVLLVIFVVTQRITTGSVNLPALVIAAFLAAAAYTGMMAGVSIGWFTARRYTDPYSTNRVRFHLDIRPLRRSRRAAGVGVRTRPHRECGLRHDMAAARTSAVLARIAVQPHTPPRPVEPLDDRTAVGHSRADVAGPPRTPRTRTRPALAGREGRRRGLDPRHRTPGRSRRHRNLPSGPTR